jgi:hypothetical protein
LKNIEQLTDRVTKDMCLRSVAAVFPWIIKDI